MTSQLLHLFPDYNHLYKIVFQLFGRFPMSLLLCVHMNNVFLLLYLHFAIGVLEESDFDMVVSELDVVSSKWYPLGQELLHEYDFDSMYTQYQQRSQIGLRQMLRKRMGYFGGLTWNDVIAGLRSSGDSQSADHLETKYCSSELTTT